MIKYYQHFSKIDNIYWTNYFLNDFIPKNKFYEVQADSNSRYVLYNNIEPYPEIKCLSKELGEKYNFPQIGSFLIFLHKSKPQLIHIDGHPEDKYRWASLNLIIQGYQNSKLLFYKKNNPLVQGIEGSEYYFDIKDLTLVDELVGDNTWTLVNSGVPHQAVDIDPTDPRITVCLRFNGNPRFEDLITLAD